METKQLALELIKKYNFHLVQVSQFTCRIENLNAMIVPIGDDELPDSVDGNASQAVKLAIGIAIGSELLRVRAVRVKHLHAMIRRVSDHDEVVGSNRAASRPRELS